MQEAFKNLNLALRLPLRCLRVSQSPSLPSVSSGDRMDAASGGRSGAAPTAAAMTDEQRSRMEDNRRRALEWRRRAASHNDAGRPACTPAGSEASGSGVSSPSGGPGCQEISSMVSASVVLASTTDAESAVQNLAERLMASGHERCVHDLLSLHRIAYA